MRKRHLLLLLLALLAGIDFIAHHDRIMLDGVRGELFGVFLKTDTVFAKGYSDHKFRAIKTGMTDTEVVWIIGEPLGKWLPYENNSFYPERQRYVAFIYSASPASTHYRLRQVHFSKGKVVDIISYFYVD